MRANIATAKFVTKVAKNSKHPLHANLNAWSVQDPDLLSNIFWGIRATHTMLSLVPDRQLPTPYLDLLVFPPGLHIPLLLTFTMLINVRKV